MTKLPLCVPYWDEREVLRAGAAYDKDFGFYIPDSAFLDDFIQWLPRRFNPVARRPFLMPDMLPSTTWQDNVRTRVSEELWNRMRKHSYAAAGHRCVICGDRGQPYLECHELWAFDDEKKIQRLRKLMALCPKCHKAHHLGFARTSGMLPDVLSHITHINSWTLVELEQALDETHRKWKERSAYQWTVDINWIFQSGYDKV